MTYDLCPSLVGITDTDYYVVFFVPIEILRANITSQKHLSSELMMMALWPSFDPCTACRSKHPSASCTHLSSLITSLLVLVVLKQSAAVTDSTIPLKLFVYSSFLHSDTRKEIRLFLLWMRLRKLLHCLTSCVAEMLCSWCPRSSPQDDRSMPLMDISLCQRRHRSSDSCCLPSEPYEKLT